MRRLFANRWWVIALVSLGTVLNYLARSTLSTVAPTLKSEFAITTEQYSYIVMAFQACYTIAQPIAGLVLDTLGSRVGLAVFAGGWALANMSHSLAGGWQGLAVARAALGLTEASAIPGGMKVVSEWFVPKERAVATGWFNMGASVGNMIAPPLVAACVIIWGWRSSFLVTGGLSLLWAALWFGVYRPPAAGGVARGGPQDRWRDIVFRRAFWGIALPRFLAEPAWQTFNFFIPLYLASVWKLDLQHIAMWAWLPFVAADFGSIAGGYFASWLVGSRGVSVTTSRKIVMTTGAALMIGPGALGFASSAQVAILLFCMGGFAHQMLSGALLTLAADLFPQRSVGRASGLAGTAAWTGGLLFTLVIGKSADYFGYSPLFGALAVLDALAALAMWRLLRGVNRTSQQD